MPLLEKPKDTPLLPMIKKRTEPLSIEALFNQTKILLVIKCLRKELMLHRRKALIMGQKENKWVDCIRGRIRNRNRLMIDVDSTHCTVTPKKSTDDSVTSSCRVSVAAVLHPVGVDNWRSVGNDSD
jgi:hypothetical protein